MSKHDSFFDSLEPRRLMATYVVDNIGDAVDGDFDPSQRTLREAIIMANTNPGADTITFSESLAGLRLDLTGTQLSVTDHVSITGLDNERTHLFGSNMSRLFNIAAGVSVTLTRLDIFGGAADVGAGIYNSGTLRLVDSVVRHNNASLAGGGIYNQGGSTILSDSYVWGNFGGDDGGGIFNGSGDVVLIGSTVSSNTVTSAGGGISNYGGIAIINSTLSQNTADSAGGGIFSVGTMTITNATIANNTGHGLHVAGATTLRSTIVSGNSGGDIIGVLATGSTHNLVKDPLSAGGLVNGANNNLVGADPLLVALTDNGGRTPTHALAAGSAAIGGGTNPLGLATDQRGGLFARGTPTDIGAYQRQVFSLVVDTVSDVDDGDYSAGNLSLREAISIGMNPGNDAIGFAPSLSGGTIALDGGVLRIRGDLTITGPGVWSLSISGEDATQVAIIERGADVTISGLEMRAGSSEGNGGGISNAGTLHLSGVRVIECHADSFGGGIFNEGTLTMTDGSIVRYGSALYGGGIMNTESGTVSMIDSDVSGSDATYGGGIYNLGAMALADLWVSRNGYPATAAGGGLFNKGTLALTSVNVTGNYATDGGGGIFNDTDGTLNASGSVLEANSTGIGGAGVYNRGVATFEGSTIALNSSDQQGGGLYNDGTATLRRSLLTGNGASEGGGGVFNLGTLSIHNSTVSGNRASTAAGGIASAGTLSISNATIAANTGHGLYVSGGASVTLLRSTILGGNSGGDIVAGSGATLAVGSTHNLVQDASSAGGLVNGVDNNLVGVDPLLGPLTSNGGPTGTHALPAESPALGAGTNPLGLTDDQRGGPFSRGTSVDIGAYQRQSLALEVSTNWDAEDGNYAPGDFSLREALALANANPLSDSITFRNTLNGKSIKLREGELLIRGELTITGPGADLLSVSGENASRVLYIEPGSVVSITGLTITKGESDQGGGIFSASASLFLSSVVVSDCRADSDLSGGGGGIYNQNGTLTVHDSTVSGNSATTSGGGIRNHAGWLMVTSTLFTANAANDGGAIFSRGETFALVGSTVSGNTAVNAGGIATFGGISTIRNTTVAFNSDIGVFWSTSTGGSMLMQSTLVSGNSRADVFGLDGSTLAPGSTHNLIQDPTWTEAAGLIDGVDNNIVGVDPELEALASNGGPTQTHALRFGSAAIGRGSNPQGLTHDQRGMGYARVRVAAIDIGAFESGFTTAKGVPSGTADAADTQRAVRVNEAGNVIVYLEGWGYQNLNQRTGAPAAIGDAVIWVDPKDGLTYVAAPSAFGLVLFTRSSGGAWTSRNLSFQTGATSSPVGNLTQFTTIADRIVIIAGVASDGKIVAFQQTLGTAPGGGPAFKFVDISADLAARGQSTPQFAKGMISYVPSWDTWHLAGIDTSGNIQSVWINPRKFSSWRTDNLSAITGAAALSGQLTVTLTSWKAINLTGLNTEGEVVTTWWIPRFRGNWANNNLTEEYSGSTLTGGNITGFVTPWGSMNYVGINGSGQVTVYWWTPVQKWVVSLLVPASTPSDKVPTGALTGVATSGGTLNVYGTNEDGDVLRISWPKPVGPGWNIENLTDIAVPL